MALMPIRSGGVQLIEKLAGEAQSAAQRGDYRRAQLYLGRALRLAPHNARLLEARKKLAQRRGGGR